MAWLYNKKILGLYAHAPGGLSWAYVGGMGWMRIRGDNPLGEAMVSTAAAQAWQKNSYVAILENPARYIYAMYTF
jgi:hypothetical protein